MEIYNNFAKIYDAFMAETPYEQWANFVFSVLEQNKIDAKLVCEVGCGTGNLTALLSTRFDMIGVDLSPDMLLVAREKNAQNDSNILYLEQDMLELELYGTVDSIVCMCDTLNYLADIDEVCEFFKLCNNYLNPNGLLIFDVNTEYKFKHIYKDNTFSDNLECGSYIWKNAYIEDEGVNVYDVTFFSLDEETGLFEKFEEYHEEKSFTLSELKEALENAGMEFVRACNLDFTDVTDTSERMYIIAKEVGKNYE